jgi:hypothetical protein
VSSIGACDGLRACDEVRLRERALEVLDRVAEVPRAVERLAGRDRAVRVLEVVEEERGGREPECARERHRGREHAREERREPVRVAPRGVERARDGVDRAVRVHARERRARLRDGVHLAPDRPHVRTQGWRWRAHARRTWPSIVR